MTLDIAKFISNSIRTQAKIQHLEVKVKTTESKSVPESVSGIISKEYGEKYLLDADYVAFFWGSIAKDDIKRLFNVVDKALGKSANKLTDTDFKKISLGDADDSAEKSSEEKDAEEDQVDSEDTGSKETDEPEEVDSDDEEKDVEDEVDEVLKEDEEQAPAAPTSYFFLKITLK